MNGGAAHEVRHLTLPSGHSRNRTVHVERSIVARVAEGLVAHRRDREILDELCGLNLAALKARHAAQAAACRKGD